MQFFIIDKAALTGTMRHGEILQRTFTALIADRAIERMRSKQKFNRALLSISCLCRLRQDDHAFFHFIGAGCLQFWHPLDLRRAILHHKLTSGTITHWAAQLHQTHATHANWLELWMMTKYGNINASQFGGI